MFVYITTVFCCTLLMCVADKLSKNGKGFTFCHYFFGFYSQYLDFAMELEQIISLHMFQLINRYIMAPSANGANISMA